MENKMRILILDLKGVLHSIKYSVGRVPARERNTYIIYNFLFKIQALKRKTRANIIVVALDSDSSKRKELYSLYKENRTEDKKTEKQKDLDRLAFPQFDAVTNYVIPTLRFNNVFGEKGLEADDIIASICKSRPNDQIVICSTDHDLYQLLTPNVCMIDVQTYAFYSVTSFIDQYGIEPHMWKRVKAIGGCVSDNVKGVPVPPVDASKKETHVAEKGALNFITGKMTPSSRAYKAITSRKGKDVINRNKPLVILPFKNTPVYSLRPDVFSKQGFIEICKKYEFKTLLEDIDSWKEYLHLF